MYELIRPRHFCFIIVLSVLFDFSNTAHALQPEEAKFLTLMNGFRAGLKLQSLVADPRVQDAARAHSDWMAGMNLMVHWGPKAWNSSGERMQWEGLPIDSLFSENIARGNFSAKDTFIQWLFSPHHMLTMITPEYEMAGVARSGCEVEADSNHCFWTNDFATLAEHLPNDWNTVGHKKPEELFKNEEILSAAETVVGPIDPTLKLTFSQNPN